MYYQADLSAETARLSKSASLLKGEAHLWLFRNDTAGRLGAAAEVMLDATERERADRFRTAELRDSFIFSHVRLREVLGSYLGLSPQQVPIVQRERGKPVLALAGRHLDFSLSHSGKYTLVSVARHRIGADVEVMRDFPGRDAIARGTFASSEAAALAELPAQYRQDGFYACWTRKEAYVKAIGLGLSEPLDAFTVAVDPRENAALIDIRSSREAARLWSLWGERVAEDCWAACAMQCVNARFELFRPE